MEMYADTESRGGILEPPGICEVKFRAPDQVTHYTHMHILYYHNMHIHYHVMHVHYHIMRTL
jgi:hypothetical protein